MRKILLGLLVAGSIISCQKDEPSPTLPTGENSITVNLNGPENWFGKNRSTGKGDPSVEYKKGPYTLELHEVGVGRVAWLRDVYTNGPAPVFDEDNGTVIKENTNYEIRIFPNIDNTNHKYKQMWDTGFNLEGKGEIAFSKGEVDADVTIMPDGISQLIVSGDAHKVTFRQWTWSVADQTWYAYNTQPAYANVPDVSFTAPHTDSSVYWNLKGIPNVENLVGNTGQNQRYTTIPATYTEKTKNAIEVIVQPSSTSEDVLTYIVGGDDSFDGTTIIANPEANKTYELVFDTYTNALNVAIISVDVSGIDTSVASTTYTTQIEVEPQPDSFDDIVFSGSGLGQNRKKVFDPVNFDGINGGYCIGVAGVTIGDAASEITRTYDAGENTMTFDTDSGFILVYDADSSSITVDGYEGTLSEASNGNVTNTRISFSGTLTKAGDTSSWTLHFRMSSFDANYTHDCSN